MSDGENLLICTACGTQYDLPADPPPKNCRICDDPRQFVPPSGQSWTSIAKMKSKYENEWSQDPKDGRIWSVWTEPKFGIGQRCILLQTPDGNVLWDVIALLDQKTIQFINSKGGLKAIVISHPHYYTTHLEWALAFGCPVYVSVEDKEWLCRADPSNVRHFIKGPTEQLSTGVTAIKAGGHFPGSLLLHWEKQLFIADTIVIIPSGLYHIDRLQGTTSFAFMWSIPNMIPLSPDEIQGIWNSLKPFDFDVARGAFVNMDIRSKEVKARVLESMKVHVRRVQSNESCALLEEAV